MKSSSRFTSAVTSSVVALVVLFALTLNVTGPDSFLRTVREFVWFILGISVFGGLARLLFKRPGILLSVSCGGLIAVIGFSIIVFIVASNI